MSTSDNTATDKRDVYARVTAQIVTAIEQGVGNWRMPWHTSGTVRLLPDQRSQQETISRNQHRVPVGRSASKGL